jgi:signal transduction histidine kinase/ligand-binding sensor domain-containing protein
MIQLRLLILVALLLGLPKASFAINPDAPVSQYIHTAWRLEDGLLDAPPRAIAQTKDGYIWIGTEAGVLRFDGIRFVPLDKVAGRALGLGGDVWSLLGASDGSLWIGSSDHLYRWHDNTLSSFAGRPGRFDAIVEDRSRGIWAIRERVQGDKKGGLCRPVGTTITCVGGETQFFSSYTLAADSNDAIWAANGSALFRFSSGSFTAFPFLSRSLDRAKGLVGVGALDPDSHGGMWVGFTSSGPGLGLEHLENGQFQHVRAGALHGEDLEVNVLHGKSNGTLWVGTGRNGILRINTDGVERYDSRNGLSGDSVRKFFEDREGDLWVLTSKGIDKFRDASIATYSRAQQLSIDYSDAATATRDGSVWTMTETGADILRGHPFPRLIDRVRLPGVKGTSILQDHSGAMWLGMDNELYRISKGVTTRIVNEVGGSVGLAGRLAEDEQGNVWISTFKMQVDDTILSYVKPNDHVARHLKTTLGMSATTIPDKRTGIWILDRAGNLAHITVGRTDLERNKVLEQKHPLGLAQGPDGTLYIWCKEGLVLIRGAEGKFIPDTQLAACQIRGSIFDLTGSLWVEGKCGLIRIQKREVENWWNAPNASPLPRLLFEGKDGYNVNWGDFSPTISLAPDGKLWFATESGLQVLDPAHLYFNSLPPPVVIESLTANHLQVPKLESNDFAAGTRDFQIDYTALSFPNPAKVFFRYKLDGHDRDWQAVGTRRQAFYTNLLPGHYTFHVTACNDSGVWNDQGASLHFDIEPAWYQTLWFHLVSVALIACILLGAYFLRARAIAERVELRVNERMSERLRISRELHDTLLQALQGIVLRFSTLTGRVSPDVQEDMDRSLDDAELLLIAGRERIKDMRRHFSEDRDLGVEIRDYVTNLPVDQGRKVTVETLGTPMPLQSIVLEESIWIAREAVTNSCQHAKAANITVQIIFTSGHFRLLVQDDGVGLSGDAFLAHYRGHFGLVSMRERAEAIGGRLDVRSGAGEGTTVTLTLSGRLAYIAKRRWLMHFFSPRTSNISKHHDAS